MGKITELIINNGFLLMIIGLATAVLSLIVLFSVQTPRYAGTMYPQLAQGGAAVGFIIYVTGRIAVLLSRRKRPPTRND